MFLQATFFKQPIEDFSVVDADCESFDADAFEKIVDHEQRFDVSGVTQRADCIEITLHEFAESPAGRPFTTPNGRDVITSKRESQFLYVLGGEACERHCQVESHRDIAVALISESKDLLVRFFPTFTEQDFCVFQRGSIDRRKAVAAIDRSRDINQMFPCHHLIRKKVTKAAKSLWFNALFFFGHGNNTTGG